MARPPKSSPHTSTRVPRPTEAVEGSDTAVPVAAPSGPPHAGADDQTMLRAAVRPMATSPSPAPSVPAETRKHTLASAIVRQAVETPIVRQDVSTKPLPAGEATGEAGQRVPVESTVTGPVQPRVASAPVVDEVEDEVADEVADEVDEWSAADQATIYLAPRAFLRQRPGSQNPDEAIRRPAPPQAPIRPSRPSAPRDVPGRAAPPLRPPFALGEERLAAPDGRVAANTPPPGMPRAALANPRMERFQELRQRRMMLDPDQREAEGARTVTESVRQWWGDLLPSVERALRHQHEARDSGVHPLSAHDETPATRLGDAFGRLSNSAREITRRTQAVVSPALRRLHDQAEQRAQALVERMEGSPARQQAPLLGPGRIAVFFQGGVTVSGAQVLLAEHQARPIRLIPRKHGFLAVVRPGTEEETAERLRRDERVRDVAYLDFDEYGQPIEPR
jgi:hypothetical protein